MPIYEYKCPQCGNVFSSIQRPSVGVDLSCVCPKCFQPAEKILSVPAPPNFVGPGFYATDYGRGK